MDPVLILVVESWQIISQTKYVISAYCQIDSYCGVTAQISHNDWLSSKVVNQQSSKPEGQVVVRYHTHANLSPQTEQKNHKKGKCALLL